MKRIFLIVLVFLPLKAYASAEDYYLMVSDKTTTLWECKQALEKAVKATIEEVCGNAYKKCNSDCLVFISKERKEAVEGCQIACAGGEVECNRSYFKNINLSDYLKYGN